LKSTSIKAKIFNYLTQAQKSDFCQHISTFVKKHSEAEIQEILNLLFEEEKHYLLTGFSRFPWIEEYLDNSEFMEDLKLFIKENKMKLKIKEKQKVLYEKQKQYQKEQKVASSVSKAEKNAEKTAMLKKLQEIINSKKSDN
jgi:hypothetical protein